MRIRHCTQNPPTRATAAGTGTVRTRFAQADPIAENAADFQQFATAADGQFSALASIMTSFAVAANEVWEAQWRIWLGGVTGADVGGVQFSFTVPTPCIVTYSAFGPSASATAFQQANGVSTVAAILPGNFVTFATATGGVLITLDMLIQSSGGVGNVFLNAQVISGGQNYKLKAGSNCIARRVA